MFECYKIEDLEIQEAEKWSNFKGNLKSINQDYWSKIAGALAEMYFQIRYHEAIRISENDYEADFILAGLRVDVKCKKRIRDPLPTYDASILAYQKEYNVDFYYFYSYNTEKKLLWRLGYIEKEEYFSKARELKKGDIDYKFTVKADCYNILYNQLH